MRLILPFSRFWCTLSPEHFWPTVYLPHVSLLCANSFCWYSQWGFTFWSPCLAQGPTLPVCLNHGKECPLFQLSSMSLHSSVTPQDKDLQLNQELVLACKICGSVARKISGPESLQDLLTCERYSLDKGACGGQELLSLLSAEGSRNWCRHCFSGCNSTEPHASCELRLPLIRLLITASSRHQILPDTWMKLMVPVSICPVEEGVKPASVRNSSFHFCTSLAGGQSCCYHEEMITHINCWKVFWFTRISELLPSFFPTLSLFFF